MQDSSWKKSAVTFVIVVVCLAVILLGGVYFLKQRSETNSGPQSSPSTKSEGDKKTNKNQEKPKNQKKSSSDSKNSDSKPKSNSKSSQSPYEVAAAGPSDYWYLPVIGIVAIGLGGYEYYLSRRTLKQIITNR